MFESMIRARSIGTKAKKKDIYEAQEIEIKKETELKNSVVPSRYSELVEKDFKGKLVIVYGKDNIGCSGGNAHWCHVYNCNNGEVSYKGTAIHKIVDLDYPDQNYNEKVWSVIGKNVLDTETIRVPEIDLVKNLEYPSDKPAVLSYNVVDRENEEMILMQTVAFNIMERADMHDNRISLNAILKACKEQINKKVVYEKQDARNKVKNAIIDLYIENHLGVNLNSFEQKNEILEKFFMMIFKIDEDTKIEEVLKELSAEENNIDLEQIANMQIKDTTIVEIIEKIQKLIKEKNDNYKEIEKSIIQTTILDIFTNNNDRHLTNWGLVRDKKTGKYVLGIFDHAATLLNMSFENENMGQSYEYTRKNWSTSSVLLEQDSKKYSSNGKQLFAYIMENYKDYAMEFLKNFYNKLNDIEQEIGYEEVPLAEYEKLPEENKKEFYKNELEVIVKPKKNN